MSLIFSGPGPSVHSIFQRGTKVCPAYPFLWPKLALGSQGQYITAGFSCTAEIDYGFKFDESGRIKEAQKC